MISSRLRDGRYFLRLFIQNFHSLRLLIYFIDAVLEIHARFSTFTAYKAPPKRFTTFYLLKLPMLEMILPSSIGKFHLL